jgi:hypothetical protein
MNTNEYIEKYSTIEKTKNQLTINMKVPPRKVANVISEMDEDSVKRKVTSTDIEKFLIDRGHKNLTCLTKSLGIDNCHPRGLERTWIFEISKPARKKTKTTNEK